MPTFWPHRARTPLPLFSLLLAATVVAPSALSPQQQIPTTEIVQGGEAAGGAVLIRFKQAPTRALLANVAREIDADRHRPVGGSGVHLFHSRRRTAAALLAQLASRDDVAYAEPNYIVRLVQAPADPRFPELWGLQNIGQAVNGGAPGTPGADIGAVSAWQVSTGTPGVVVGVIDTGVDYTHPDLAGSVWSAPASFEVILGGARLRCPAGTHGFNALTRSCDPMDDHNHGSHVSGTIGAGGNNGIGVAGVNWTASVMALKFIGPDGSGTVADAIDAIEFAIQAKATFAPTGEANVRVLSNSWGGSEFSQALFDAILRARDHDMLFVAAAGNSGLPNDLFPLYPASYTAPNVVSVAATDNADRRAYFSNYGKASVHLGAPGVNILSTVIGGEYAYASGTSMATPHVSGAAALVLSECDLDVVALKNDLLDNVDLVAALADYTVTGGRLNVDRALRACSALPAVPTGLAATAGNAEVRLWWAEASGATWYRVKRSLTPGGPYVAVGQGRAAAFVDATVTNDTAYYYVVSSVNLVGESADSTEAAATPKVPADLSITSLTVPSAAGAGQTIVVTETVSNQGPGVAGASTTRFFLSANATLDGGDAVLDGTRQVPALPAGASSTGSTPVTIPAGTPVGTHYVIAKADADDDVGETSEANNTSARALPVGPDLVVSVLQVPFTVTAGAPVTVNDTIKNQGGGTAGGSTVRFYLSSDLTLDATDVPLGAGRLVPSLAAGASNSGSTSVTVPASTPAGTYYVFAKADAGEAVTETSEANNTSARAVQTGADLVVSSLSVVSSAPDSLLVTDTTANQGTGAAAASTTRFYLSANAILDAGDQALDGSRAIPAIGAGQSSTGSVQLPLPAGLSVGTYYLIAMADADKTVPETSEANNATARAIASGPDLVIASLAVQTTAVAGTIVATDTVKNQGSAAAGASTVRFYLSANLTLDATDAILEGTRTVPALAAGLSSFGSTSLVIPASTPAGSYYVIAQADAANAVQETSETNNTAARLIPIGPDLVIWSLQVPFTPGPGGSLAVSHTIKNQGGGNAGTSTTRFYLSANLTLDAGDTLLDGSIAVPALPAGASATGSTVLTIPESTPVGTYYVMAKADADEEVGETVELNNTSARAVQTGPDLVVPALSVPWTATPGQVVGMTETTRNQGSGPAGPSVTRLYLSTNVALDASDTPLGERVLPGLAAGASNSGTTSVSIPAGLAAGIYYVIAQADANLDVPETSDTNNLTIRMMQIK